MPRSVLDRYQRIAPFYDLLDLPFELFRYRKIRPLLFQGLSGRLLDVGVGTGRNMPFYPAGAEMVGVDISAKMLARAKQRRATLGSRVALRRMDITRLDFPDDVFDAAIASFVFCVLPDDLQVAALRELARVVRTGGTIRLMEYVRPSGALRSAVTRLWAPWMAFAYGAGFDRRSEEHIRGASLQVASARFVVSDMIKLTEIRVG